MAAETTSTDTPTTDTMASGGHHYCIVSDGGRQYRVSEGQEIEVDFRPIDAGSELVFDKVLAVSKEGKLHIGAPIIDGAVVKLSLIHI